MSEPTKQKALPDEAPPTDEDAVAEAKSANGAERGDEGREAPDSEAPDSAAPDSAAPDSAAPDSAAPDSEAPDSEAPDSEARDSEAPDSEARDSEAPDSSASDSSAPDSAAPDSEGAASSDDAPAAKEEEVATEDPVPDIRVELVGRTDVGQIREHNEDNFLIGDLTVRSRDFGDDVAKVELGRGGLLMVVCDGMGGAAAGEVASQLATDIVFDRMLEASGHCERDQLAVDIVEALEVAGAQILDQSNKNRACRGMGTTATVAALVDDHLLLGQVGDSRAYILREERLVQVTRDQSLVNQLIEAGQLTEEEAENFEHSNIILQALGTAEAVQVDLTYAQLRKGDILMMCSDGLSGMIRDYEIRDILVHVDTMEETCQVLIDDANQAGGHDNITVIVARFDGEGLQEPTSEDVEALRYAKYTLPRHTMPGSARMGALGYDDTPLIEITGEFEIDPHTNWDDLLDPPHIPKEEGPVPNAVIWVAIAVLAFAVYYLIAQ